MDYTKVMAEIAAKLRRTMVPATQSDQIPYESRDGHWVKAPYAGNSWWTAGFWPGLMWQLYAATGDAAFQQEAQRTDELLAQEMRKFYEMNHDVGFMYLLSTGAEYKLTGHEQAKWDTLHAASLLMGRFNPEGFIRAWNGSDQQGLAIIDCLMNLPLLFWASRLTGDPRFGKVATIHADTALREFLRPDGSVSHIIVFDPENGQRVAELGGQGYALGSQWTRGQAWGLYGFTLMHLNTGEARYLDAARKVADNFIRHIRPDGLVDCDFCQPETPFKLDNIAGACAACGLLELAKITGEDRFRAEAVRLVDAMLTRCVDWTDRVCGLLTHCTSAYHDNGAGQHTNIIYGDYFLVEALNKLTGRDPMLWR